jgi:hypothetical protein
MMEPGAVNTSGIREKGLVFLFGRRAGNDLPFKSYQPCFALPAADHLVVTETLKEETSTTRGGLLTGFGDIYVAVVGTPHTFVYPLVTDLALSRLKRVEEIRGELLRSTLKGPVRFKGNRDH